MKPDQSLFEALFRQSRVKLTCVEFDNSNPIRDDEFNEACSYISIISPKWIGLQGAHLGDEGYVGLSSLSSVCGLDLSGSTVTDDHMAHVAKMKNLHSLTLTNTAVTDRGLEYLHGLRQLEKFEFDETHITSDGLRRLRDALPHLKTQMVRQRNPSETL